jgi:hypothetical protein|tara:strand:+ start:604 stop:1194 length:591 start_codon:yes stop_codon:yes gene_type:complete
MPYLGTAPTPFASPETFEDIFPITTPQNVFTLSRDVVSETDIMISINGVVQHGASHILSGVNNRTLTLDANLEENDELRVLHYGFKAVSINTGAPDDDSVTTQKLSNNAVETLKIADDAVTGPKIDDGAISANHINSSLSLAGPSLGDDSIIRTNKKNISQNIVFDGDENGMTVGPITIDPTFYVTVTAGSTWTII